MNVSGYPHYKSTNAPWLKDIPEHWEVKRLKWSVAALVSGTWGGEPNDVEDLICIRVADFDREKLRIANRPSTLRAIPISDRRERLLQSGDLLIEKSGGGEKQLVGCVVLYDVEEDAVSSNFIARMRLVPNSSPRFWTYVHAALYAGRLNYPAVKQTTGIQNLDTSAYLNTLVAFPPSNEQVTISTFLDGETARIDALAERKRTLIERLREKRSALVSRAVTRGVPPEAATDGETLPQALKPSGIDWLGEIPEHWETRRISMLAKPGVKTFTDGDWVESPYITNEGIRLIQTGNIGIGTYKEQGFRYIDEASFGELGCTEVEPGDVLICRLADPVGRACLAPKLTSRMITSVDVCILKPAPFTDPRFIVFFLSSKPYLEYVSALCRGGTRDRISRTMLGSIRIALPPLAEQKAIADYVERESARLEGLIQQVETALDHLQEYRTALINAAVTGKIDVREAVA